ncbi:VirK family antimicrobial peptide resistance protein [Campylobacter jejuni]|nr:VirK family antimicrobial peptide resistance protein [Campylobacter jejuni]EKT0454279.1 VirK family antimicrobial peptide resistance protein [Campylobacter jejuni]
MNNYFHYSIPKFHDNIIQRKIRFYLRKILYFRQIRFFEKELNNKKNTHLKNFFTPRSHDYYTAFRKFCDKSFGINERVKTIIYDVNKGLEVFKFLPNDQIVFSFDEDYHIYLGYNHRVIEEGFWAFSLKYKEYTIQQCSFCFTLENNILIACIQGYKYQDFNILEINKILTKKSHGLRPASLLIECSKILCEVLQLNYTLGVHENNQMRSHKKENKGYFVNYKKTWLENGGELIRLKKHKYYKLSITHKNIENIASHKRSMYKKRFNMLKDIKQNLNTLICNKPFDKIDYSDHV